MFSQRDRVNPHLISKNRFSNNIANNIGIGQRNATGAVGNISERIEA
jgi:hypothetical protein